MAISYELGANPIWYIANNIGLPLGGGFLVPSSSLNPTIRKFIYRDSAGPDGAGVWPLVPIPNLDPSIRGILFDENGQQGPFYFSFDTGNPDDLYFLQIFDSSGNLVRTVEDYDPSRGGGGSVVTTVQNAQNLITNNIFWRHIPDMSPISSTSFRVAPSVHSALALTSSIAGPDTYFIKTNTSATDNLTFPTFAASEGYGVNVLINDIQPVDFLKYQCSVAGSSEIEKCIQIPISQNVLNLSGNVVTITLWTKSFSGLESTLSLYWRQFFGNGNNTPTTDVKTLIDSVTVDTSWVKYTISVTVPSVGTLSPPANVGNCHNDGLFLLIRFPLNATCNIGITKPSLYLNNVSVKADYQTYDQIDSVINAPRTGHTVASMETLIPFGYVYMNDGTIGSASSGSVSNTHTPSDYCFPLFNLIWNNTNATSTTKSWAPIYDSSGVLTSRGASAIEDFSANKRLQLLYAYGAAIGNTGLPNSSIYQTVYGTTWALGQPAGNELNSLTVAQMPSHTHTFVGPGGTSSGIQSGSGVSNVTGLTGSTGGGEAHNTIQPIVRLNYFIKL